MIDDGGTSSFRRKGYLALHMDAAECSLLPAVCCVWIFVDIPEPDLSSNRATLVLSVGKLESSLMHTREIAAER